MDLPSLPNNPFQHDHSLVPASVINLRQLADQVAAMGIHCLFAPDHSVGMSGFIKVQVGSNTVHQINIPAATALLDGVLLGAREMTRIITLPKD